MRRLIAAESISRAVRENITARSECGTGLNTVKHRLCGPVALTMG